MTRIVQVFILLLTFNAGVAQTPVPMASQPGLTYTEDFADIANWTDNFASGFGSSCWASVAVNATGTIGDGIKTTHSTAAFITTFGTSEGVQRGGFSSNPPGTIVLLAVNTVANTNAVAIDILLNFSGVNSGTISFDWTRVNNSTGDRVGSLKVFSSTNGTTFTELTGAAVNNIINNAGIASGSITTVSLPSSFNNSSTARLRFYYFNGTANGTTGARPKISIDNLTITAVPNTPCVTPAAQPTALSFGTITSSSIAGSFTAASPTASEYLTIISNSSSLTSYPIDGTVYNLGDNVGDGFVAAKSNSLNFTASGLSASTTYYFFIFAVNSVCIGGPKYLIASPLTGNATSAAGTPPCTTPLSQPASLGFGTATVNSITGTFTVTTADEYLILQSTSSSLSNNPVNTSVYTTGDIIGNATVVQQSNNSSFTASGLSAGTVYYFYIFSLNSSNCSNGPLYNTISPLTGSSSTAPLSPCTTPSAQPAGLSFSASNNALSGSFTGGLNADTYLVIKSNAPSLSATPVNNTDYNVGDNLGGGAVVANSSSTSFVANNLIANTTYYFFVFAANKNCSGGTKYLTVNPLTGNATTTNAPVNNYYFGNIHSHSDYSDGNQDNPGYTPTDDYSYAMVSQCMDFLGISEHNHYTSNNNPGTLLSNYHLGVTQANNFSAGNPGFLALYGMEWGVINNGGHVVIYGDGMDNLFGWESNVGSISGNNYDVFVAKSDYTGTNGLFKVINDNVATNAFGSLAHPNSGDFDNIANIAYDAVADNAISATTVESGPATSTVTNYTNPASSLSYLWYYQKLLAIGYHVGPTIDHDNHNTTFGRTTYSRTAVIAPALTKTEIIKAYRNMHFYATQDCDTKVDFTINTRIMGSIFTDHHAPVITVNISDATTSTTNAIIRVMYGVPGSGNTAVKIDSVIGSSLNFIDNNLSNLSTGYYYIDIKNGNSRMITSPIWYTRQDDVVLPVTFSSFLVQKADKRVKLSWGTEQEINSSHFIIERSADGRTWNGIATIAAAGYSSGHIEYIAFDNSPLNGINYYRIKQVDKDARFEFSVVKSISFNTAYIVMISPNPAKDIIAIDIAKNNTKAITIQLLDATGKLIRTETTVQSHQLMSTAGLTRGLYFIKVTDANTVTTLKLLLQ